MSRVRTRAFGFDALEVRKLLTAGHPLARPHAMPMIAATPIVLNGTLSVGNKLASTIDNPDGSTTTATPLQGNVGALGKVSGVWNQTVDQFGDSTGMDVLRLGNAKGTVVLTFNTSNAVKAHTAGHGTVSFSRAQKLYAGTGAYAGSKESGMLDLTTNGSKSEIVSITLKSASS